MKRILVALLLISAAFGQNTAKFPTAVAGLADIGLAKDGPNRSTLSAGITNSTLAVPVLDGSVFRAYNIVTFIDTGEQSMICSISTNTLTLCTGSRGFAGTAAAAHSSGIGVLGLMVAWSPNQMAAEIIATQTALGAGLANVSTPTWSTLTGKPSTFAPSLHAAAHATGQPDAISPSSIGLGSVENTAISTWAGSANIMAIGTLASGTVPWARLSGVPAGVWNVSGSNINYMAGNVGIGTITPISGSTLTLSSSSPATLAIESTITPTDTASFAGIAAYTADGTASGVVGGTINFRANGAWTTSNHGADIVFRGISNASTALTEWVRFRNGNVGIGTNSPQFPLHVSHTPGTSPQFGIGVDGNPLYSLQFTYTNPNGVIQALNNGSGSYLSLNPAGGNVGIGDSVLPGARLTVAGGFFGLTYNGGGVYPGNDDGTSAHPAFTIGTNFSGGGGEANLWNNYLGGTAGFSFLQKTGTSAATTLVRMLGNGNVGIGTTNPLNPFQVHVATNQNLGIRNYSSRTSIGAFNDTGSTAVQLGFDALSFDFEGGNVGIGEASPSALLSISHNITGSTALNMIVLKNSTASDNATSRIQYQGYTGTNGLASIDFIGNSSSNWNTAIGFSIGTSEKMRVAANGYVGIGMTAPTSPLQIVAPGAPATSGDMNTGIIIGSGYGGAALNIGGAAGASPYGWLSSGYTNNAGVYQALSLQPNGGNVGIGKTNPATALDVSGTITATQFSGSGAAKIANAYSHEASWTWQDNYLALPLSTVQQGVFAAEATQDTITSVQCWSDTSDAVLQLKRSDGGDMISGNVACNGSVSTSFNGYNVIPVGWFVGMWAVSGTAKRINVAITYTTSY